MDAIPLIYPIEKSCCNFKRKRAVPYRLSVPCFRSFIQLYRSISIFDLMLDFSLASASDFLCSDWLYSKHSRSYGRTRPGKDIASLNRCAYGRSIVRTKWKRQHHSASPQHVRLRKELHLRMDGEIADHGLQAFCQAISEAAIRIGFYISDYCGTSMLFRNKWLSANLTFETRFCASERCEPPQPLCKIQLDNN